MLTLILTSLDISYSSLLMDDILPARLQLHRAATDNDKSYLLEWEACGMDSEMNYLPNAKSTILSAESDSGTRVFAFAEFSTFACDCEISTDVNVTNIKDHWLMKDALARNIHGSKLHADDSLNDCAESGTSRESFDVSDGLNDDVTHGPLDATSATVETTLLGQHELPYISVRRLSDAELVDRGHTVRCEGVLCSWNLQPANVNRCIDICFISEYSSVNGYCIVLLGHL